MPCGAIQADEFFGGGGIFRGLVISPAPGEPGEPQCEPGILFDLSPGGGVVGG